GVMAAQQSLADRTTQLRAEAAALSSSDRLGGLVFKTFDLLGQLQNKELGAEDLEFRLQSFEAERELMKKHDRIPATPIRSMMYGLVETLYGTVEKMLTEGRIRVKEDNTSRDESKSTSSGMEGAEGKNDRKKEPVQPPQVSAAAAAAAAATATPPPPVVNSALVAAAAAPSVATAIPAASATPAATAATTEKKFTASVGRMPLPIKLPKKEPADEISEIVIDTVKEENVEADEIAAKNEEMSDDDAVSHNADGEMAGDNGIVNNMDNDDRAQFEMPELDDMRDGFENERVYAMTNDPQDNEMRSEDDEKEDGDREKDSSDMNRKRRSSRKVRKPTKFIQESEPVVKKRRTIVLNKIVATAPECLLCEVCPSTPTSYISHLSKQHMSNLSDHGIYLLCACGAKYRHATADIKHTAECAHTDYTVHKLTDQ
ncbi:hypothetical protein PRIPAC_72241, partial [Pristionchus pacificus]